MKNDNIATYACMNDAVVLVNFWCKYTCIQTKMWLNFGKSTIWVHLTPKDFIIIIYSANLYCLMDYSYSQYLEILLWYLFSGHNGKWLHMKILIILCAPIRVILRNLVTIHIKYVIVSPSSQHQVLLLYNWFDRFSLAVLCCIAWVVRKSQLLLPVGRRPAKNVFCLQ